VNTWSTFRRHKIAGDVLMNMDLDTFFHIVLLPTGVRSKLTIEITKLREDEGLCLVLPL